MADLQKSLAKAIAMKRQKAQEEQLALFKVGSGFSLHESNFTCEKVQRGK